MILEMQRTLQELLTAPTFAVYTPEPAKEQRGLSGWKDFWFRIQTRGRKPSLADFWLPEGFEDLLE